MFPNHYIVVSWLLYNAIIISPQIQCGGRSVTFCKEGLLFILTILVGSRTGQWTCSNSTDGLALLGEIWLPNTDTMELSREHGQLHQRDIVQADGGQDGHRRLQRGRL